MKLSLMVTLKLLLSKFKCNLILNYEDRRLVRRSFFNDTNMNFCAVKIYKITKITTNLQNYVLLVLTKLHNGVIIYTCFHLDY